MKSRIFHLRSLGAWLKRKRKTFSSPWRRYRHRKSESKGSPSTDRNARHGEAHHDSLDDSSSSLMGALIRPKSSRSGSSSEDTSCLEDSQLRNSSDLSLSESNNQPQNSRGSPSLGTGNQLNQPQDLSPAVGNSQPGNTYALSSLNSNDQPNSCVPSSSASDTPSRGSQTRCGGLTNLPYILFLEIISLVSPPDLVRSRRVSKTLRSALTSQALCMSLILDYFPLAREARILRGWVTGEDYPEMEGNDLDTTDWAAVFAQLARRYWYLSRGKPREASKITMRKDLQASHGVKPWNRFMFGNNATAEFHHWDPFWTCAPDLGLIVYPTPSSGSLDPLDFRARDINTGHECAVPFRLSDGSLIRVHTSDGVLLFAFVVKSDAGYSFFIEAFDIIMRPPALPRLDLYSNKNLQEARVARLSFSSRGRSQLLSMDRPLSHEDRFFCTHNSTHFALYTWIPASDPTFTTVLPLEELTVWNIGLPQRGPRSERNEPKRILTHETSALQHLGLSQNFSPRLRSLELDKVTLDHHTSSACGHIYLVEDDHDLLAGPHTGASSGVGHCVESTGIPLSGTGPAWREICLGKAPGRETRFSYTHFANANHDRASAERQARWQRMQGGDTTMSLDYACSSRPQCWRHENFPYVTVSQAFDTAAGVRFQACQLFRHHDITVSFPPGAYPHHTDGWEPSSADVHPLMINQVSFFGRYLWDWLMAKGQIYGDERWLVGEDLQGQITILRF